MSVGAICFTSSGSNGGCWVVLVFPRPFLEKRFFFPYATYAKKKVYATYTKKIPSKKKPNLGPKKNFHNLHQKKKAIAVVSTIKLRFPPLASP